VFKTASRCLKAVAGDPGVDHVASEREEAASEHPDKGVVITSSVSVYDPGNGSLLFWTLVVVAVFNHLFLSSVVGVTPRPAAAEPLEVCAVKHGVVQDCRGWQDAIFSCCTTSLPSLLFLTRIAVVFGWGVPRTATADVFVVAVVRAPRAALRVGIIVVAFCTFTVVSRPSGILAGVPAQTLILSSSTSLCVSSSAAAVGIVRCCSCPLLPLP
jgi:hypothetical protein